MPPEVIIARIARLVAQDPTRATCCRCRDGEQCREEAARWVFEVAASSDASEQLERDEHQQRTDWYVKEERMEASENLEHGVR